MERVTIGTREGLAAEVLAWGATLRTVRVRLASGDQRTVGLGHATLDEYRRSPHYPGATIGRYANRIAGASVVIDHDEYSLHANEGDNHLHGGEGFDRRPWSILEAGESQVRLGLRSGAGDQGYPGNLDVVCHYEVSGTTLRIAYEAVTDAPTLVNLTHHLYLNLDGEGNDVRGHRLQVAAEEYTPTDSGGIPLGVLEAVAGTNLDLREPCVLGDVIDATGGLDHNYVLGDAPAARLTSTTGDLVAVLETDGPGLQVFTANGFDGRPGLTGPHPRHGGVALEPQAFPDTPHHPEWGDTVLRPGQVYRRELAWTFTAY